MVSQYIVKCSQRNPIINMEPINTVGVVQDGSKNEKDSINDKHVELVDVELVRRTKTGDIGAFEELFNRYHKRVYNIVARLIGDENDAADLTQDVFVRVFNSINGLRVEEAFFTWLRAVTTNICRDFLRRKPPRMDSLDATVQLRDGEAEKPLPDPQAGPEKLFLDEDRERTVRKAISSLSYDYRIVVIMHHLEGMDVKDIAKLLGTPIGTIKSRLARARDELRRKLGPFVE